jgi:hypothetical protein
MSAALRCWLECIVALLVLCFDASAQDKVKVEVRVTSVTNASCYLDKGRAAGLEIGDRVLFYSTSGVGSEGTIRAVSKNSARAEIDPGAPAVELGARGEAFVPATRIEKPAPVEPKPAPTTPPSPQQPAPKIGEVPPGQVPPPRAPPRTVPEHPPWQQAPEEWSKDKPLLAPAFGLAPEDREPRLRGRAYVQAQGTRDDSGSTREYFNGNAGFDATLDNPFGDGGSLRMDATLWTRSADADFDDVHTDETRIRLNRLTYELGGTQDDPTRWMFGRFLQREFPQLGVLDGVEWDRRLANGSVLGASAGAMPEPFSDMSSFDDMQAALFYRHAFDESRRNFVGLAYQNTWHDGDQDRNLFVADAAFVPGDRVRLNANALVDWYGSGDEIKDEGFELTELLLSGTWLVTSTSGVGLTYSHRRIPELLRSEFHDYDAPTVRDNELDRVALNGWHMFTPKVRVDARADLWDDHEDSGQTVEAGLSLRNMLWSDGELSAAVFHADGSYSSGPGFRVNASKAFGRTSASLGYTWVDYSQKDFTGEQSELAQQALFGTFDLPLSERCDLSLLGERRFGDEQDAYTLGLMVQWRF